MWTSIDHISFFRNTLNFHNLHACFLYFLLMFSFFFYFRFSFLILNSPPVFYIQIVTLLFRTIKELVNENVNNLVAFRNSWPRVWETCNYNEETISDYLVKLKIYAKTILEWDPLYFQEEFLKRKAILCLVYAYPFYYKLYDRNISSVFL